MTVDVNGEFAGRQHLLVYQPPDADFRQIELLLIAFGFRVCLADSPAAFSSLADSSRCDMIIVGIPPHEAPLREVLIQLKRRYSDRYLPVLMIAGRDRLPQGHAWINAGVDDFLIEPVHEHVLYARVRSLLRLKQFHDRLGRQNRQLLTEMEMARTIQQNIMNSSAPRLGNYTVCSRYIPAMDIGGDFYDIYSISEGLTGIFIADVAGHGVQAALITMMVKGVFDAIKQHYRRPDELLEALNTRLIPQLDPLRTFLTGFSIVLDVWTGRISYASAGHPGQYMFRSDGSVEELQSSGGLLGFPLGKGFESAETQISHGDLLFLFTDGLTDTVNPDGESFGEERLQQYGTGAVNCSAEQFIDGLLESLNRFRVDMDLEAADDINMIVLKAGN